MTVRTLTIPAAIDDEHPVVTEAEALIASGAERRDVYFPPLPDDFATVLVASADRTFQQEVPWLVAAAITAEEDGTGYIAWIIPEGLETSDKRFIEPGALTWRDGALPLMFLDRYTWGHDEAEFAGNIVNPRRRERDGYEWVIGDVVWDDPEDNENAAEAKRLVDEGRLFGISADIVDVVADITITEIDEDGWPIDWLETYTQGVVAGATIVPIPAFEDAHIEADGPAADTEAEDEPVEAEASAHSEALTALARLIGTDPDTLAALVAGATITMPDVVPARYFGDPEFDRPTGLTITEEDGVVRIFGHAATWGVCHVGITDRCITAPHSATDYAEFLLGQIETDEGMLAVGTITMGTGHAPGGRLTAAQTRAHYDNTGQAVAWVNVGEDDHGIWFNGVLRGTLTEDDVQTLRASKLSGDWRKVNSNLELVALLAVNVPGFAVKVLEHDHEQTGLVAAGMVDAEPCDCVDVDTASDDEAEGIEVRPEALYFQLGNQINLPDGNWTIAQSDRDDYPIMFVPVTEDGEPDPNTVGILDDTDALNVLTVADDPAFLRVALHLMEALDRMSESVQQVRAEVTRPAAAARAEAAAARLPKPEQPKLSQDIMNRIAAVNGRSK